MSNYFEALDNLIDQTWSCAPLFQNAFTSLESVTHVERHRIAKCLLFMIAVYMTFGAFAELICNGVGFIYPAIQSLEALETHDPDDDRKWLTYWVVFAAFSVIEFYSDKIFHVFPVYYLTKLIFLVWCFWPAEENGSMRIYRNIIRPFYLKRKASSDVEGKEDESIDGSIIVTDEVKPTAPIKETPSMTKAKISKRISDLLDEIEEKEKQLDDGAIEALETKLSEDKSNPR